MSRKLGAFNPASTATTFHFADAIDISKVSLYLPFDDDFNDYEYCENGREEEDRNMAEWENILFDIEEAFTTMKNTEHFERSAAQNQTIKHGLMLFATHYERLWD